MLFGLSIDISLPQATGNTEIKTAETYLINVKLGPAFAPQEN
jgi:hypothetical protein